MKNIINFFCLSLIFIFLSCSIEKRRYQSGYHIEWAFKNKHIPGKNTEIKASSNFQPSHSLAIRPEEAIVEIPKDINCSSSNATSTQKINEKKENITITKSSPPEKRTLKASSNPATKKPIDKKSGDGVFITIGGLLSVISFGLFRTRVNRIKKVSYWAKNNKQKSRIALTGLKFLLAGLGIYTGKTLFENHLLISETITNALIGTSLFAAFLYPKKKSGEKGNSFYIRQKTHDFALSMSGFLVMASVSNHALADKQYFPFANSVMETVDHVFPLPVYSISESNNTKYYDHTIQTVTVNRSDIKEDSAGRIIGKILLCILVISLFVFLEAIILGLSCNLSCNGHDTLAVVVGVGGTVLNVILLINFLKMILKKKKTVDVNPQTAPLEKK